MKHCRDECILECLVACTTPGPAKEGYRMGGEATPGLGPPEEELVLGRVSNDLALCIPPVLKPGLVLLPVPGGARPACPAWYGLGAVGRTVCKGRLTKESSAASGSILELERTCCSAGLRLALSLQTVVSEAARVRGHGGVCLSGEKAV